MPPLGFFAGLGFTGSSVDLGFFFFGGMLSMRFNTSSRFLSSSEGPDPPMAYLPDDPASVRYLATLGSVAVRWNQTEQTLRTILNTMVGTDERIEIFTSNLSNVSLQDAMVTLANEFHEEPLIGHIKHYSAYFDRLREYRNWLVHSVLAIGTNEQGETIGISSTSSAKTRLSLHSKITTLAELEWCVAEMDKLMAYSTQILGAVTGIDKIAPGFQPLSSLEKPLLPDRLQKPRQSRLNAKPQPQPSQG